VMRSLARAHQLNGEPALAEETMRRAVDANPRDASARLDLAQLLTDLGKAQQAKPVIDELVKQEPDNMAALEIQYKVGAAIDDKAEALAAADAMVATHPKVALGYYYQGRVAESEQRLAEAARLYQTALEVQPETVEPLQSLAQVLVRLKRTPEALQRLDAAIAQYPKVAFALNAKGQILLNEQNAADAVAAFKTAIQREPTWWVPYRGLALAQSAQNDAVGGVATLRAGVSAVKQRLPLQLELAAFLERLGKSDEAIQVFDDELKKDPQSDVAANNLAMLLSTYKNDPQSMDRAKALSARFASSTNPEFLDTYGWVLYKHGDSVAALAALHTAVSKSPNSPVLLYHLGMAQASAGQGVAARDSLERSLQSGKNFSGKDQAKAALEKLATAAPSGAPPPKT
jgi:predicted Zn-dependent protease